MLATKVFLRFYKSFNFDYLRKTNPKSERRLWEDTAAGFWYPYVSVSLEPGITTVVGANESGKSQLLSALEHALTGADILAADFCRYSQFFVVDGAMSKPDFGLELGQLSEEERAVVAAACNLESDLTAMTFALFRLGDGKNNIYFETPEGWETHPVIDINSLNQVLPAPFTIRSNVPLPDSVPLQFMQTGAAEDFYPRASRMTFLESSLRLLRDPNSPPDPQAAKISLFDVLAGGRSQGTEADEQLRLADDLLTKVARVDRRVFQELAAAVRDGKEGYANGIVEKINEELAKSLNFPKWWSQDNEFQLLVTLRDMDLVFTIRDRTQTEYVFSERSNGLKYFLSYFVQYLAHVPANNRSQEILLMDEPDAYLSSQGQQDLLQIFEAFTEPRDGRNGCQVVYVTHSPFLIDKNHGERIRVLEKGDGDEGSRVVKNVARNHFEPLRTAFGGFVAETTFIGNCNVMLEGLADQVLLAGMSSVLRLRETPKTENLDLNQITLVPTGSAAHIPYMVYLARGRDVDRPAIVVLLDSDSSGNDAKKELKRGGPRGKQVLDEAFILQIGDLPLESLRVDVPGKISEIEDLVPLNIALPAAKDYVREFLGLEDFERVAHIDVSDIDVVADGSIHGTLQSVVASVLGEFHLDKVGFARSVMNIVRKRPNGVNIENIETNFRVLFKHLARMQRAAVRALELDRASARIKRARKSFFLDHSTGGATREEVSVLFEELSAALDSSVDAETFRLELHKIADEFDLAVDITSNVADFPTLKERLESLEYQEQRESQEREFETPNPT
jgi:AAA domain, putative AbiEii toxin, Type IV TA system